MCARYERIQPAHAERAWRAAYKAAAHENAGGRLSHIQMLTGSTLPLLPLLEGLVKKHAPILTKREQAVAAVRVQLEGSRLVGVRFPRQVRTIPPDLPPSMAAIHLLGQGLPWPSFTFSDNEDGACHVHTTRADVATPC